LYANITFHHSTELQGTTVRITFNPDQGSWSFGAYHTCSTLRCIEQCRTVGTKNSSIPAGQATMNLGWIADTTNIADDERGVILHEFGHVLGLLHEYVLFYNLAVSFLIMIILQTRKPRMFWNHSSG
jgi:hypothetical protein